MPSFAPPKRAVAYTTYVSLVDQANTKLFKAAATIATGDWKVSKDGGALANLATLPVVEPAGGVLVKIDLSADEMTADNVSVVGIDAAGAEWCNLTLNLATVTNRFDDLATAAGVGALSIPSAADIAAAVWAATERTLTGFGTLVADIWAAAVRTLTESGAGGATPQEVWEYAPRTLTQTAAQVAAALEGSNLNIVSSVSFTATLTGLTLPATWSKIYFTAKQTMGDPDSNSVVQMVVSSPADAADGLLVFNRVVAGLDADQGSLTPGATSLTITLSDVATTQLVGGDYRYDVKAILAADGTSVLLAVGMVNVSSTPTQALA